MEIILIKSLTDKPWRSEETYFLIEAALREGWANVSTIQPASERELSDYLTERRRKKRGLFVFNIAEYLDEARKTGFIQKVLEDMAIPHLGSTVRTIEIGLDKAETKRLLSKQDIPTPAYFVTTPNDPNQTATARRIGYPLLIKPLLEGGHIGINDDSIVNDKDELARIVESRFAAHRQPLLVEEYIDEEGMREFSVGIIDTYTDRRRESASSSRGDTGSRTVRLFTPVEIDYDNMHVERRILSYDAAQKDLERVKLVEDQETAERINDLASRTFQAVGASDYSRVDIRMNNKGWYVLEINIMPGLGPHSFLPFAAKEIHRLDYGQLIRRLASGSMSRQGIE